MISTGRAPDTFDQVPNVDAGQLMSLPDCSIVSGRDLAAAMIFHQIEESPEVAEGVVVIRPSTPQPFLKPVKYSYDVIAALKKHQTADQVRLRAIEVMSSELAHRNVVNSGEIHGGTAFGIAVSVLYWLVRNDESEAQHLAGRFRILKGDILREKANRDDPRAPFYAAMLAADTYEAYYRLTGSEPVTIESYRSGPITAHMEIAYARRNGWIGDM